MRDHAELSRLLVATRDVREANRNRVLSLAERVRFDDLGSFLRRQRLLALVGSRLMEVAGDAVPEAFRAQVEASTTGQRGAGVLLETICAQALASLEAAGVAAVPLKGPHLAADVYGDIGLRSSSDVDLLVAPSDLDAAVRVLTREKFLPPSDPLFGGRPLLHYRLQPRGIGAALELHWRIHWYETRFAEELVATSRETLGVRKVDATLGLAALLLYYVRDGLRGLRYPADIAAWWDRHEGSIEARALTSVTRAYPKLRRPLLAAAQVAGPLVGLPTEHLVAPSTIVDRRTTQACRLATLEVEADHDQLEADRVLIDYLVSPNGGGWQYFERHMLRPNLPQLDRRQRFLHPFKLIIRQLRALIAPRPDRARLGRPSQDRRNRTGLD